MLIDTMEVSSKPTELDYESTYVNSMIKSGKKIVEIPIENLKPAPSEWNFFPPISEGKMLEMMMSIQENGLFNPITIWNRGEEYMILSGHNRVNAYKRIVDEFKDTEGFDPKEYETIGAIMYDVDEIDENKAKEIIIDTN